LGFLFDPFDALEVISKLRLHDGREKISALAISLRATVRTAQCDKP
jgi:hypothetical protein